MRRPEPTNQPSSAPRLAWAGTPRAGDVEGRQQQRGQDDDEDHGPRDADRPLPLLAAIAGAVGEGEARQRRAAPGGPASAPTP